jgi:hypothetical protein
MSCRRIYLPSEYLFSCYFGLGFVTLGYDNLEQVTFDSANNVVVLVVVVGVGGGGGDQGPEPRLRLHCSH